MIDGEPQRSETHEEPPPFLGAWRNVYVLVLLELAVTVAVFYALARWAA